MIHFLLSKIYYSHSVESLERTQQHAGRSNKPHRKDEESERDLSSFHSTHKFTNCHWSQPGRSVFVGRFLLPSWVQTGSPFRPRPWRTTSTFLECVADLNWIQGAAFTQRWQKHKGNSGFTDYSSIWNNPVERDSFHDRTPHTLSSRSSDFLPLSKNVHSSL